MLVAGGTAFCQTFGAVLQKELAEGEKFFLDNRYAVAFSDTVTYQLVKATESVRDSIMSGEGLINRYTGPGVVYYQTRGKAPVSFQQSKLAALNIFSAYT